MTNHKPSTEADLARAVALREAAKISASEPRVWESSALPPQQRIAAKILSLLTQSAADALEAELDQKVAEALDELLAEIDGTSLTGAIKNEIRFLVNRFKARGGQS